MGSITYRTCENCEARESPHKILKKGWVVIRGRINIDYKGFRHEGFSTFDFCSLKCLREYVGRRIDDLEDEKCPHLLGFWWPTRW